MNERHRRIQLCIMGKADLELPSELRTEGRAGYQIGERQGKISKGRRDTRSSLICGASGCSKRQLQSSLAKP